MSQPLFINFHVRARHQGGGGDRIRTDDPLLAKQMLYQLSYAPSRGLPLGTTAVLPHMTLAPGGAMHRAKRTVRREGRWWA